MRVQRLVHGRLEGDLEVRGQLHPLVVEVGAFLQLGEATGLDGGGGRRRRLRDLHLVHLTAYRLGGHKTTYYSPTHVFRICAAGIT